jgi:hypothetical protein
MGSEQRKAAARKAEGRRRGQDLVAYFIKANDIPPGIFPSSMLPSVMGSERIEALLQPAGVPRVTAGAVRARRLPPAENPRGRQKSQHTVDLEKILLKNGRLPAKAKPLKYWLAVVHAEGIMYTTADGRLIPYPSAIPEHYNTIYPRFKKILESKLLPGR